MVKEQNENVDFEIIREDYSTYKTENGLILKVKQALLELKRIQKETGESGVKFGSRDISHVIALDFEEDPNLQVAIAEEVSEKNETRKITFQRLKEPTNLYETEKSIIAITTHVISISMTNKKNANGVPILRYRAAGDVAVTEKPKFDEITI